MEGQGQAQSCHLRREGERASWARTCDTLGQRASSSSCGLAGVGGRTWMLGGHRKRIQRTVIESWSLDRGLGFGVQSGRWGDRLGRMGPWSGACPLGPSQPSLALPLAVTGSAVERTMLGAWRVKQHLALGAGRAVWPAHRCHSGNWGHQPALVCQQPSSWEIHHSQAGWARGHLVQTHLPLGPGTAALKGSNPLASIRAPLGAVDGARRCW